MARQDEVGFDRAIDIVAPPSRVVAAFFNPASLADWWEVERSVTTPRLLGAYALQWPTTDVRDDLLGPLGGALRGTVMEFHPERGFFIADVYWLPPEGEPVGPMAVTVSCSPGSRGEVRPTTLRFAQTGYEESARWRRYYAVIGAAMPGALSRLKHYLEHGRGAWDLGAW
jgi:uncharacterized protein YndB with AHSA1/START domain